MTTLKIGDRAKLLPFEQAIKLGIAPTTRDSIYGISRVTYEELANSKELVLQRVGDCTTSFRVKNLSNGEWFYIPFSLIIDATPKISDKLKKKLFDNFKIRV